VVSCARGTHAHEELGLTHARFAHHEHSQIWECEHSVDRKLALAAAAADTLSAAAAAAAAAADAAAAAGSAVTYASPRDELQAPTTRKLLVGVGGGW
jgi:hypothetical protein